MANFNFNKVIIGGRLTADPELKVTPAGVSVTSFTVAVNRKSGENAAADFFDVTAWRATAEFITRYFCKASSICIVGSLRRDEWVDKSGVKRFKVRIEAEEAYFVDKKSEMAGGGAEVNMPVGAGAVGGEAADFGTIEPDEELQF